MGSNVVFDSPHLDRCLRFGQYLDVIMPFLLGDSSSMFRFVFNCGFGLLGSHIWWWTIWWYLILWSITHLMPYWGMFPFWLTFIDLHGVTCLSPLTRYTSRRWPIFYLVMILRWSPSWAIQLDSHFSTFRCRHTSPSGYVFFDTWAPFNYGFGLQRSHIWWWMISGHPISDLPYIWCHTRAYFRFSWEL